MKHRQIALLMVVCLLIVAFFSPVSGAAPVKAETAQVTISQSALEARFLNILNHNNNYGDDFKYIDTMVNNSVLSLLHLRDSENEDFIRAEYVINFVKDLYGIEIVDVSELNAQWPQLDGYIYIIPKGYATYTHEFISMEKNEDESYTVHTAVTVDWHDGEPETFEAVSLIVPNSDSSFGYSLIRCDLVTPAAATI